MQAKKINTTWHCGNAKGYVKVTGITRINDTEKIMVLHPKDNYLSPESFDSIVLHDFVEQSFIIQEILNKLPSSVVSGNFCFRVRVKKSNHQSQ